MWQRKQTIYLILATILMAVSAVYSTEDYVLLGIGAVTTLLSFVAIFLFGNRKRQMMVCRLAQLMIVAWMGYFAYEHLYASPVMKPMYLLDGPILPVVSYLVLWLAIAGIRHDENLIRSADRIR